MVAGWRNPTLPTTGTSDSNITASQERKTNSHLATSSSSVTTWPLQDRRFDKEPGPEAETVTHVPNSLSHQIWKNFSRDLIAGGLMGGVAHTIVAPIERTKLLLQTQDSNIAIMGGHHKRYNGMLDCIVRVTKEEGFLSLWRGNGSSVLRYYPSLALNFSCKVTISFFISHLKFIDVHKDEYLIEYFKSLILSAKMFILTFHSFKEAYRI